MIDYKMIISRCLNKIEKDLLSGITVEDVCDFAGHSQYHFLRVFVAFTGVPLSSYIRSRKLSEAAKDIIYSKDSINNIGKKYGYERKEVFSRSFKNYFRMLPSEYRLNQNLIYYQPKINLSGRQERMNKGECMNYKITEYPDLHVVGFKIKTATKDSKSNIAQAWAKLTDRLNEFPNDEKLMKVGVIFHDPRFVERAPEAEEEWFYMAGIASAEEFSVPKGLEKYIVPASRYAVFTTKTSSEEMCKTYKYISIDWMKESEEEYIPHDEIELYDDRYNPEDHQNSYMDLLIPIK